MAKYLVTGGAGFIGSNLVEYLLNKGEEVVALDNFATGKKENIKDFLKSPNFRFFRIDLRNKKELAKVVKGVDFILHQAAIPSVLRSIEDMKTTFEANILGTINLLETTKKEKIKKLVFASSSSIYGPGPLPKREEMCPNPISPYALSKLTGEKLCQIFSKIYGLPTICLRYFNVFGPRQNPTSEYAAVIPKFIKAFFIDQRPVIYGDGQQTRDFTYVVNVVEANILAARAKFSQGEIFNIAVGQQTSLLELIDILNKIFGKRVQPLFAREKQGDVKHSFADITKAKKELAWQPKINFKQGLQKTIDWFQKSKSGNSSCSDIKK